MNKLCVNIEALRGMHRFGDILEEAIRSIESDMAEFTPIRDAKDCIGRHWYGMRCQVVSKKTRTGYYLHIGLIYYKATRQGLMVELDEQNNKSCYAGVISNIKESNTFEINKDEAEYFKLFMPDNTFTGMSGAARQTQKEYLRNYVQAAGEAIEEADSQRGFELNYKNLSDALGLLEAFEKTLKEVDGELSNVWINYKDPDNFGQYAQGFRYYLSDKAGSIRLYAYFGAIYSYKKEPTGIFAEIDWYSNQEVFQSVYDYMTESPIYEFSKKEPKFIKLFMSEEMTKQLNESTYEKQLEVLKAFLKEANDRMIQAGIKGGEADGR